MRVAVVGAGAIGAFLADASAAAGHAVTVCLRTPIDSLVIERDGTTQAVPATFTTSPEALSAAADLVFLTVKANDTEGAAGWLSALGRPPALVVAVQNGLDQDARVNPHVAQGTRVVPGIAYVAAEKLAPGRVRHLAGGRLVVPAPCRDEVQAALADDRVQVSGTDDMWSAAWRKLLGNLVANPITALTMRRIDVMGDPGISELARGILAEAVEVGRASGAELDPALIDQVIEATGQYGPRTGSSMLYDRLAGRPTEHRFLTGEVVRRGAELGIPVPLNSAVLALLDAIDRGR